MKSGYLAPTKQQRLGYINWLHVYAKDCSRLLLCMAELIDNYVELANQSIPWIHYETGSLYDVFEPSLLSTALSLNHNLGHLVFGTELWAELGGVKSDGQDQLTNFFQQQGSLNTPTFLRPSHYNPLFLDSSSICSLALPHRPVYTYTNDKQIWSIIPFPENSQGMKTIEDSAVPLAIVGAQRSRMLFSYIIEKTQRVAIGPLEYCGNAHRVSIGSSIVVTPCYGNPSLPEYYAIRDLKSRYLPSMSWGARHEAKFESQVQEITINIAQKQSRDENEAPGGAVGLLKGAQEDSCKLCSDVSLGAWFSSVQLITKDVIKLIQIRARNNSTYSEFLSWKIPSHGAFSFVQVMMQASPNITSNRSEFVWVFQLKDNLFDASKVLWHVRNNFIHSEFLSWTIPSYGEFLLGRSIGFGSTLSDIDY
ncbi:hypothetical protein B0H10DRAFT_1949907 [Mycena sp. CBHHK59/15]|nr:hypothetical protein B0H10DRAFT_1949907 [Mycena sp. CBHHK59/15]